MISPYSADDTDDINEYTNYWRKWEEAERLASATYCDFQLSCWSCDRLCGDGDYYYEPCYEAEDLPVIADLPEPTKYQCTVCGADTYRNKHRDGMVFCSLKCLYDWLHTNRKITVRDIE